MPRAKQPRKCEICGKTFYYTSHLRNVCSEECLQKRRQQKLEEYNEKRRTWRKNQHPYSRQAATDTMLALEMDVIEAHEKGISYGYFSALRGKE